MSLKRNLPPVPVTNFSMVPRSDVPRSTFKSSHAHKTTFSAGYLIPIHVDEVLPGDVHRGKMVVFCRLATPLFPIMDNIWLESFFFFVPCRLVWDNWRRMMGEQPTAGASIDFTVPQVWSPSGGWAVCSIGDYFGLPVVGQFAGGVVASTNAMPLRAYNLIYNEWFRDENLSDATTVAKDDGPDPATNYGLIYRRKQHDYFTSCLPWPLKGGTEVPLPLSGNAPIASSGAAGATLGIFSTVAGANRELKTVPTAFGVESDIYFDSTDVPGTTMYADLSAVTSTTINALRLAITTQQFLERDARGGTRYTELLRSHFGVTPEDARLQRPEYIGGGKSFVQTSAIPQTAPASGPGDPTVGALGAAATITGSHEFSYSATEHGYIIGLVQVRADLTYQQGLHKMWSRLTRYDFYWPTFANLGEQAVLSKEIYCDGTVGDDNVFGYQERWAEYRHYPSRISGLFRSTSAGTIDPWHVAIDFSARPTLNNSFLGDSVAALPRALAGGALEANKQILFDSVFELSRTRAMPVYSVPGLSRF